MQSTVRVDTTTVAFTVTGHGPALLVLHGAGASKDINWGFLADRLVDRFTVIASDLPGSGDTVDDGDLLAYDAMLQQAIETVAAAGHQQFHVLGYSLGAHLAVALAAAHPSRVLSLTAIAGWLAPDAYMRLEFDLWQKLHATDPDTFARFAVLTGSHPDWLASASDAEVEGLIATFAHILAPGTGRQAEFITRTGLPTDEVARITVPTLLVALSADRQVPPAHTRALHEAITGSQLQLIDAGHIAPWQAPDALAQAVTGFLATRVPAAASRPA